MSILDIFKSVNELLADHIDELNKISPLSSNWAWDAKAKENLKNLYRIDECLIEDLNKLHQQHKDNPETFTKVMPLLQRLHQEIELIKKQGLPNADIQQKEAELINQITVQVKKILDEYLKSEQHTKNLEQLKEYFYDLEVLNQEMKLFFVLKIKDLEKISKYLPDYRQSFEALRLMVKQEITFVQKHWEDIIQMVPYTNDPTCDINDYTKKAFQDLTELITHHKEFLEKHWKDIKQIPEYEKRTTYILFFYLHQILNKDISFAEKHWNIIIKLIKYDIGKKEDISSRGILELLNRILEKSELLNKSMIIKTNAEILLNGLIDNKNSHIILDLLNLLLEDENMTVDDFNLVLGLIDKISKLPHEKAKTVFLIWNNTHIKNRKNYLNASFLKILEEGFNLSRKRVSFYINPKNINPSLSGKISVQIRFFPDKSMDVAQFLKIVEYSKLPLNEYQKKVEDFLKNSVIQLLERYTDLFIKIYSKKINFNLFLDIQSGNVNASVGEIIKKEYALNEGSKIITINKIDPTNKNLEINIYLDLLAIIIESKNHKEFIETIVHELNHLYDKRALISSKIRGEGIATFSEFAYSHSLPRYLNRKVFSFLEGEDYKTNLMKFFDNPEIQLPEINDPYIIGEFMCFVIFAVSLKKKYPLKQFNLLNEEDIKRLSKDQESVEHAKNILILLRNTTDDSFLNLYFQATETNEAKELKIQKKITTKEEYKSY